MTTESEANFNFGLLCREAYSYVPDKRVSFAVGYPDLKPYPRLKELSFSFLLKKNGSVSVRLRQPALISTSCFIIPVVLKIC